MNRLISRIVLLLISLLILQTHGAAHTILTTSDGLPIRWPTSELTYYVNSDGSGLNEQVLIEVIQRSFESWSEASDGTLFFRFGGVTSSKNSLVDGMNVIFWDDDRSVVSRGAFAETRLNRDVITGEILDADIALNLRDGIAVEVPALCPEGPGYAFNPIGIPLTWNFEEQRARLREIAFLFADYLSDVQATLTHEIGHALGLGHSDVSGASMSTIYETPEFYCTVDQRTLEADDIAAIRELYPPEPPPDPEPPSDPTLLYTNGNPLLADGSSVGIDTVITSDDFTLTNSATLRTVRFWTSRFPPRFGGVYWAIHADAGGIPTDTPIASGIVQEFVSEVVGTRPQCCGFPDTSLWRVEVPIPPTTLEPGTYWLGIHDGDPNDSVRHAGSNAESAAPNGTSGVCQKYVAAWVEVNPPGAPTGWFCILGDSQLAFELLGTD